MDPATEQQAPEAVEQNLSDALEQQYDAMEAAEAEAAESVEAEQPEPEEEAPEVEAAAEETSEPEGDPDEQEASPDDDAPYDVAAPERWPAELKEAYGQMDAQGKKVFMEKLYKPMQSGYTRRTQELAEMRKKLDPMVRTLEQHQDAFQQAGLAPEQVFRDQVAWAAHFARVGPQQGIADMQRAMGLESQTQADPSADSDDWMTPTEKALKAKLDSIESHISQTTASQQEQQQRAEQEAAMRQQVEGVRTELAAFAGETTPDGAPLHPHLNDVSQEMAGLLRGGLVPKVDDYGNPIPMREQLSMAYGRAVQLNPSLREQAQAQADQERQAKMVAAASRDVPAKAPAGQVDVQAGPITDTISSIYDSLSRGR